MPAHDYKPRSGEEVAQREMLRAALSPAHGNDSVLIAILRVEEKIDKLMAAMIKPKSGIILVSEDIARIAAEIKRAPQTTEKP